MNRALVRRATAGVAAWLRARGQLGVVVVGRDARHGSRAFCDDTAAVLAGAGFDVRVLPRPLPTPVLAFATRHLGAVAGIMITASHNPREDNGYKLYLGDGAQIVPPDDAEISAQIDAIERAGRRAAGRCGDGPRRRGRRRLPRRRGRPARARRPAPGRPPSTPHCTAWGARPCGRRWRAPASHRLSRSWSRPSRIPASRRWRSRTRRSPGALDLALARARARPAPTSCWPTTRTPTDWPWPCPTSGSPAGGAP